MRIAVDASGGDYAPYEIVKGVIKAAQELKDKGVEIILVGKRPVLHVQAGRHLKKLNISIVHAPQNIEFNEHPMEALRNKPKSSIAVGTMLVKEGKADAFVSAGSTGAVLCAAYLLLGKIEGIERPALGSIIKLVPHAPALLLDAGANSDCRPQHLVEFARLGNIYAKYVMGVETPRIALMSNGEEETKGNKLVVETHQLLKVAPGLKFIGNVEGHDLVRNSADVIVTDGFTGNVLIKAFEGLGDSIIKIRQVGQAVSSASHLRGRALLADVGMGHMAKSMDFREYGGACLLGVKGTIIVSHGRSRAKAMKNAIFTAKRTVEQRIPELIAEEVKAHGSSTTIPV
jgi:glycerol-3-phosphate acyltransferase PlsX